MKKVLCIVLAAVLVLAFAAVFFAGDGNITGQAIAKPTFLQKIFGAQTPAAPAISPANAGGPTPANGMQPLPANPPAADNGVTISVFYRSPELPHRVKLYRRFSNEAPGLLAIEGSRDNFVMNARYFVNSDSTK